MIPYRGGGGHEIIVKIRLQTNANVRKWNILAKKFVLYLNLSILHRPLGIQNVL